MSTPLSRHFTLEELIHSDIATRKGIDNTPNIDQLANLTELAEKADRVRDFLGAPMLISSGFRSPKVNAAIGSKATSAHCLGHAIDFTCPGFGTPKEIFAALKTLDCGYDQLILEFPDSSNGGWVHLSFEPRERGQALVYDGHQYRVA